MKLLVALPLLVLIGCGSGPPPEITSFTVEPSIAARGTDVMISIVVANFELREPEPEMGQALRPAHDAGEGEDNDYPDGGHFHVYLDNTESNPMFINCPEYCEHGAPASPVRARIPDDMAIGEHTVIARLNDDRHLFLKPEIRATTTLTVLMEN
jgi:hypothetical protein